jgi:hypothetical protein
LRTHSCKSGVRGDDLRVDRIDTSVGIASHPVRVMPVGRSGRKQTWEVEWGIRSLSEDEEEEDRWDEGSLWHRDVVGVVMCDDSMFIRRG